MNSTIIICETILIVVIVIIAILKNWMSSPNIIGKLGEKRVYRKLKRLSNEYITLNDVLLPTPNGTTQIDHIVVSPYGIFVIETKNYKGWIFGHEKSDEWKQSLLGKKDGRDWSSVQHKLRNPILQNAAHIKAVKATLNDVGDFPIIPIVAFSDNAKLHLTTPNHIVINWNKLRFVIMSYTSQHISQNEIQNIVRKITSTNITFIGSREKHNCNIQHIQQNRTQTIANGKCPKCGSNLIEKHGKYGKFLGCSNYPNCQFTHNP